MYLFLLRYLMFQTPLHVIIRCIIAFCLTIFIFNRLLKIHRQFSRQVHTRKLWTNKVSKIPWNGSQIAPIFSDCYNFSTKQRKNKTIWTLYLIKTLLVLELSPWQQKQSYLVPWLRRLNMVTFTYMVNICKWIKDLTRLCNIYVTFFRTHT